MSVTKKATGIEVVFTVSTGEDITGAALALTIPSELSLISGVASTGSFSSPTWTIGALSAGDEETLTLLFNVADLSLESVDVVGALTYNETLPDTADDTVTKTVTAADVGGAKFPVRVLTDTNSPHDVLVGIDSAITLDGTSGAVTLNLGDPAGWIYPDGSAYSIAIQVINVANAVTIDAGADNIIDDVGASATSITPAAGESMVITSNGTNFYIVASGGALA